MQNSSPQIGALQLSGRVIMAPMAGVTDRAFRQLCREQGAALTVTEMVSTKALHFANLAGRLHEDKTTALLAMQPDDVPTAVQIFGSDPQTMAEGARLALDCCPAPIIDINMGCPAPKIVNNGDGSALMKNPILAGQIIHAVKQAVDVPVTVKFRMGWDFSSVNCVEFARIAAQSGADMIAVHGRTRSQMYEGTANWDAIAAVKQAVDIPVAANGDIFTAQDAVEVVRHTQADFVMIGRGALGNPFLMAQAHAALEGLPIPAQPSLAACLQTAMRQMELAAADKGEYVAMREARRHVNWYLKGESGMKPYKARVTQLETLDDLRTLCADIMQMENGKLWCGQLA